MRWRVAIALAVLAVAAQSGQAVAQAPPPQCLAFGDLRNDAQQKATAVRTALEKKLDRKEVCAAATRFYAAEEAVLQFLEKNKTWCGIPEEAIKGTKVSHERTLKFRTAACTEDAKPRPPSLSDAIGTPSVDTGSNTRTGHGTLDSLNGNPLAR
jgi:hypothetical protein